MNMQQLLMVAAAQGGGVPIVLTPGPELWPQPAFNASTGLTLFRCSVTGGQLVSNAAGSGATCTATLTAGTINIGDQFQYSFDIVSNPSLDAVSFSIGGTFVRFNVKAVGTYSGTYTAASVANQDVVVALPDNFDVDKIDNVSVKKLS